jgi:uncharacterized protein YxjI
MRDRYKIYDDSQNVVYHVEGKMFSFVSKMDFYRTKDGVHLYTMTKKIFTIMPKYFMKSPEGADVATVSKRFTLLSQKFDIHAEFGNLEMTGNAWGYDFQVTQDGKLLLEVHKKWISWGDTYEITVHDETKTDLLVGLVVLIDNCLHENHQQSQSTINVRR